MAKKKKKKQSQEEIFLKAMRKSNREIQFLRNGGGQWVAQDRVWKNKKSYNRKRDKKVDLTDCLASFFWRSDADKCVWRVQVS